MFNVHYCNTACSYSNAVGWSNTTIDTIWAGVASHVSCNLQLHPDIYKMAVQHVFDINMSQSASLLNVARCFRISTKLSHAFKPSLDFCGNLQGFGSEDVCVCVCASVSFCLATFGDTFWTTHYSSWLETGKCFLLNSAPQAPHQPKFVWFRLWPHLVFDIQYIGYSYSSNP